MNNNNLYIEKSSPGTEAGVILDNDYVFVTLKEDKSLIFLRWKRQITPEERQKTFMWAYGYSKAEKIRNWLIDDQALFILTPEEKSWITNTWTRLVAASGIEKIAVVTSDHFPNLQANAPFTAEAQEQYRQHSSTEHEVFTEFQLAYQWLQEGL